MKTTAITEETVYAACEAALNRGDRLTFDNVYAALEKRGSAKLVMGYLRQFRAERGISIARGPRKETGGGDFVQEVGIEFLNRLWELATAFNESEFSAREAQLDEQRKRIAGEVAQAKAEVEASAQIALSASQDANAARAQADLISSHLDEMRSLYERERTQREAALSDLSRLNEKLASLQAAHESAMKAADELLAKTILKSADDLSLERERSAGERQALMQQTDRQRQEFASQQSELKKQLAAQIQRTDTQTARAESAEKELREAKTQLRELEVKLSASQDRASRVQQRFDELQQNSARNSATLGTLQGRIAALEERRSEDLQRIQMNEARLETLTAQLHAWQVAAATAKIKTPDALREHLDRVSLPPRT